MGNSINKMDRNINLADKKIILTTRDSTIEITKSPFEIRVKTIVNKETSHICIPKSMVDDLLNAIKYVNAVEYIK